ncbi:GDP-mannose 4,6-dehydratase [Seohaeicola saemankumensis]|nr:GDP-mannose 4,6-dehydratase [Seohaeicola saemankumensis]
MSTDRCVLILGGGGFVGTHLQKALLDRFGASVRVVNTSRKPQDPALLPLDITDTEAVRAVILREKPTHVINLVGIASPVAARRDPALAWELHALAPERLGQVIREEMPGSWLFHVSSGLIYGKAALEVDLVDEKTRLEPMDTYSMTKAAGDMALGVLAGEGLKCIRLRPFNHTGPGQTEDFVVPAFAAQLARISAGLQEPVLRVGNLSAIRDFLDVRDVVAAYTTLVERSDHLETGAIYNIASGHGHSMRDILDKLIALAGVPVRVELDPDRQRPSDLPRIVGSTTALAQAIAWVPTRTIQETLADVLGSWLKSEESNR